MPQLNSVRNLPIRRMTVLDSKIECKRPNPKGYSKTSHNVLEISTDLCKESNFSILEFAQTSRNSKV